MKVAIRDDDVSFFTQPDTLARLWAGLGVPVSFAVTPFMVDTEACSLPGRECSALQIGRIEHPLRDNPELIGYLREQLRDGKASVVLHGCDHRYHVNGDSVQAEFGSGTFDELYARASRAHREIEALFGTFIDVFVPPDNAICREGMQAVAAAGLRFVQRAFPLRGRDTPLTPRWADYYARRLYHRTVHGIVYSRPFDNGFVVEGPAYLFKRTRSLERLKRDFDTFHAAGLPFTLATHHWELQDPETRDKLYRLLEYVFRHPDVRFVPLREVFI